MTTECYVDKCAFHGCHEGDEGPFCFHDTCHQDSEVLLNIARLTKLIQDGYEVIKLEPDNWQEEGDLMKLPLQHIQDMKLALKHYESMLVTPVEIPDKLPMQYIMKRMNYMIAKAGIYNLDAEVLASFVLSLSPNVTKDKLGDAIASALVEWDL